MRDPTNNYTGSTSAKPHSLWLTCGCQPPTSIHSITPHRMSNASLAVCECNPQIHQSKKQRTTLVRSCHCHAIENHKLLIISSSYRSLGVRLWFNQKFLEIRVKLNDTSFVHCVKFTPEHQKKFIISCRNQHGIIITYFNVSPFYWNVERSYSLSRAADNIVYWAKCKNSLQINEGSI